MQNILVDANNLLYRSISTSDKYIENTGNVRRLDKNGEDITSIQKFFSDVYFHTEQFHEKNSRIFLVWDRKIDPNGINWRTKVNPLYKANRGTIENNDLKKKVHFLCKHIKLIADAYGLYSVFPLESEGDDIINYLEKTLRGDSVIVSADHDFFQCVNENCSVYNVGKRELITVDNFENHVPVALEHFIKWKSIKGDASDNIKGLYRYGDKKAKKLVENWEEESKKLTEEQLEIVEETVTLIDLNHKPLSGKEIQTIEYQTKPKEKKQDWELTRVLDTYGVNYKTRELWDKFSFISEF